MLYAIGDRVSQAQYGNGTITMANEHHTVIDFDEHGSRTFSTPLVQLERSASLPPLKRVKGRRRPAAPAART